MIAIAERRRLASKCREVLFEVCFRVLWQADVDDSIVLFGTGFVFCRWWASNATSGPAQEYYSITSDQASARATHDSG